MCLLANTPFRLLQFEAISTRNGVAYPKKQSKYDSLLGVFVAVGIQASGVFHENDRPSGIVSCTGSILRIEGQVSRNEHS